MSAIQKSREQEKLRRATEKETWDNVSKFFEIDDAKKAVALQALQNQPVSTSRAGACFIFKQRYEIYLSAGKQYVDYAKVANLLIAWCGRAMMTMLPSKCHLQSSIACLSVLSKGYSLRFGNATGWDLRAQRPCTAVTSRSHRGHTAVT